MARHAPGKNASQGPGPGTDLEPGAGLESGADLESAADLIGWEPDEVGRILAILGGSVRKGAWEPPARLQVLALMGGVELDFREADLLEGETVVEVLAIMGGVNITVPPDVDLQVDGTGFLGGFTSVGNRAKDADAPRLIIKGLAVMGGVDVKVKKLPLFKSLTAGRR